MREELVKNFCSRELTSYRQIFEGAGLSDLVLCYYFISAHVTSVCLMTSNSNSLIFAILLELAKLDKAERRYAWIKRRLRTNEEIWKIFPPSWHVAYLLCIQFCKLTRFVALFFDFKF